MLNSVNAYDSYRYNVWHFEKGKFDTQMIWSMKERPSIAMLIDRKIIEIVKYQSNFSSYSISRHFISLISFSAYQEH